MTSTLWTRLVGNWGSRLSWLVAALLWPCLAAGQEAQRAAEAEARFGAGVHAYFDGDLATALNAFDRASQLDASDPRILYWRGVVHWRMEARDLAIADFERGAHLEVSQTRQFYPVNRSLERVQGPWRLELEQARNQAFRQAIAQAAEQARLRYGSAGRPAPKFDPPSDEPTPTPNLPDVSKVDDPTAPFAKRHQPDDQSP